MEGRRPPNLTLLGIQRKGAQSHAALESRMLSKCRTALLMTFIARALPSSAFGTFSPHGGEKATQSHSARNSEKGGAVSRSSGIKNAIEMSHCSSNDIHRESAPLIRLRHLLPSWRGEGHPISLCSEFRERGRSLTQLWNQECYRNVALLF